MPGAGFAVAGHLGPQGEPLAAAVRAAFTDGLGDAMRADALIAILAAVLVAGVDHDASASSFTPTIATPWLTPMSATPSLKATRAY